MKSIIFIFTLLFLGTIIQGHSTTSPTLDAMSKKIYVGNLPHHYEADDVNQLVLEVTGYKCKSKKIKSGKFLLKFKDRATMSNINKLDGYKVEGKSVTIHHAEQDAD